MPASASADNIRIIALPKGEPSFGAELIVSAADAEAIEAAAVDDDCVTRITPDEYRVRLDVRHRATSFRRVKKAWKIFGEPPAGIDGRHLLAALCLRLDLVRLERADRRPKPERRITDADRAMFAKGPGRRTDERSLAAYRAIASKLRFLGVDQ